MPLRLQPNINMASRVPTKRHPSLTTFSRCWMWSAPDRSGTAAAASFTVAVVLEKPAPARRKFGKENRIFMGISWSIEQPDIGVRIRDTFIGLPSQKGGLVGGDVILRVGDAPVNTPQDVVFHWDQAEKGAALTFHCQRTETHRFILPKVALQSLQIDWSEAIPHAPVLPIVSTSNASPQWLRAVQCQAAPQPGDLVIAVGGTSVGSRKEADTLLRRASMRAQDASATGADRVMLEVSALRGAPNAVHGAAASAGCCFGLLCSGRTRIPKARRQNGGAATTVHLSETLLSVVPPMSEPHAMSVTGSADGVEEMEA